MTRLLVAYQAALVLAALTSGLATGIAWTSRDQRGGAPLAVLLAATTVWTGADLAQTVWRGQQFTLFWDKVVLTAVVVLVASLLVFALEYTGREEYVTPRTLGLLAVGPVGFTALLWTNEYHSLVWRTVELSGRGADGVTTVAGPVYTLHTFYSYAILAIGVVLIVVFAVRSQHLYRRQVTAIVVATLVPWFANGVHQVVDLGYDPTPVMFTVTGVAFTWAVLQEDFLDITPIATELVFDTIDTAVFVVDEHDRVVDLNQPACEIFGLSADETVGSDARSVLAGIPNAQEVYEDVVPSSTTTTREFRAGERYIRVQVSPLFGQREERIGHVFLVLDLTEERRREEQLERRNEQLDRFAGVVSHDLRNPLEVASGSLQLARETGDDEHFDRVERSHERMETLIDDLLVLARQDDSPGTETVDLDAVASAAWKYVDTGEATLTVTDDAESFEADEDRLVQLFENLFRNAVEHGGPAVTVTVESTESGFAVSDDGSGFDGSDVDQLFEEGYTTSPDGTGFGLAIVADIVASHGWDVSATQSDAGGARFEFTVEETA